MVRDNRHVSTYIFGAICPDRRQEPAPAKAGGAAMIMPYANAEAMNAHLREISAEVAPGAHAVLVCDGAGWHQRGKKLALPDNITLLSLPPYSPELTPWRTSGPTCARTSYVPASETPTKTSPTPVKAPGASSATTPNESARSEPGTGPVSPPKKIGRASCRERVGQ